MHGMESRGLDGYDINVLDYWKVLVKRRKPLLLVSGCALALSIVVSLLLPNKYDATARILPPEKSSPSIPFLSSQVDDLIQPMFGIGQGFTSTLWAEELASCNAMDAVISRFGLMKLYDKKNLDDTRKALKKRVSVEKSDAGIISITVEDTDPQRAAGMANAFMEELDRINRSSTMGSGRQVRLFLEKRIDETREKLDAAGAALKKFQESNNALKMDAQSESIIDAIGKLKGNLMAKEVEYRTLQSYASSGNPQLDILKTEVAEMRGELRKLEDGTGGGGGRAAGDVFIPTSRFPGLQQQYQGLFREYKMQETLYGLLMSQYEQAKIKEAKDSPTIQVLDRATPPTKKAKPNRALIVLSSTVVAAVLAIFLVFLAEYRENSKKRSNTFEKTSVQ